MFWKLSCEELAEDRRDGDVARDGRFVLHRHRDAAGEHLDLRLECEGYLQGWRIDGLRLENDAWATEKAPHPVRWLDHDGDAVRVDAGEYAWERRDHDGGMLVLHGRDGVKRIRVEREPGIPACAARAIKEKLDGLGAAASEAASLIGDGVVARSRAIERLCGLGRELDGSAFDDTVWRKTLAALTLDEIHVQLRGFEVRFDLRYPPQSVSRPEVLDDERGETRSDVALSILRD